MMRYLSVVVLVSLIFNTFASPVPVFLWSGKSYLSSGKSNHHEWSKGTDVSVISEVVESSLKKEELPELFLAFLTTKLSSSDISLQSGAYSKKHEVHGPLTALKRVLEHAQSSLSAPFVYSSFGAANEIMTGLSTLAVPVSLPKSITQAKDGSMCDSLARFLDESHAREKIYANGKPELVVVRSDNVEELSSCMERLSNMVHGNTNGRYVSLFAADRPSLELQMEFGQAEARIQPVSIMSAVSIQAVGDSKPLTGQAAGYNMPNYYSYCSSNFTTNSRGPTMISSSILLGVMVSIALVFVVLCGSSMLMSVEAPPRFSTIRLQQGRVDEGSK